MILDCTLRDGGYYTNWDFDWKLVQNYIKKINNLPIDYIEIGYRSNDMGNEYMGEYFYLPIKTIKKIHSLSNAKISLMLNEKSTSPDDVENLLSDCIQYVDLIRIAVNPERLDEAYILAKAIKKLGIKVSFNMMYMSKWNTIENFYKKLKEKELFGVIDFFYMVDSYGSLLYKDVLDIYKNIYNSIDPTIKIGFHGHNNLEMALSNTIQLMDNGIDIVDSTVLGMGRGAGNLKTEILLTYLSSKVEYEINFDILSSLTEDFQELLDKYNWGTKLPYMVSAINSLPQKDVMYWMTRNIYSSNSIIRALNNQKNGKSDNIILEKFYPTKKFKNVLIIGGGPSAITHYDAVNEFLAKFDNEIAVIHASTKNSRIYSNIKNKQYYCLVGNEGYRLEKVFDGKSKINIPCIIPPYPRKMGTYIPENIKSAYELEKIDWIDKWKDAHTAIAISTALELDAENIFFIGYDGYVNENITIKEQQLIVENEYFFNQLKNIVNFCSLSNTNYNMNVKSIYKQIS